MRIPPVVWAGVVTVVLLTIAILCGLLTGPGPQPTCTPTPGSTATPTACATPTGS